MSRRPWARHPGAPWALLICAAAAGAVAARPPATVTQETARVAQAAGRLAEDEAVRRLAPVFGVPARQVADLREQKLAFGDAAAALAIALVGRKSINTVVTLWANERLDWADVATRLGAPRARVVRLLRRARQALDPPPARRAVPPPPVRQ